MPETFSARLRKCVSKADLTTNEVARWFRRPRPTTNTWLKEGRCPSGPAGEAAFEDLALLEWAVKNNDQLPVPKRLNFIQRAVLLNECYEHARRNARVPSLHSAGRNGG